MHNRFASMISLYALSTVCFAADKGTGSGTTPPAPAVVPPVVPAPVVPAPQTAAASAAPRVTPIISAVADGIPMPAKKVTERGSKNIYPFDQLTAVGMSFGVENKTARQMAGLIGAANKRSFGDKIGEDGKPVYVMKNLTDADGNPVQVATNEIVQVALKKFAVADVNPETDPAKCKARVWRVNP